MIAQGETGNHACLDRNAVREAVMADPGLVREDAELLHRIAGGEPDGNVIDLAAVARGRLLEENRRLKAGAATFAANARANLAVLSQVHMAALGLLEADSLRDLDRALDTHAPGALGVDCLRAYVEGAAPLAQARAILPASPGLADRLLGDEADYVGPVNAASAAVLYGPQGGRIQSQALVRLDIAGRTGVLAAGSRDANAFVEGQGTELLHFFARTLERLIGKWART